MADLRPLPTPDRMGGLSPAAFAALVTVGALVLVSMNNVAPSLGQLADGVPGMLRLVGRMLPPNTEADFLARIALRILETFQIALAGAAIGIVLSLPIAWLSARGLSPWPR